MHVSFYVVSQVACTNMHLSAVPSSVADTHSACCALYVLHLSGAKSQASICYVAAAAADDDQIADGNDVLRACEGFGLAVVAYHRASIMGN